MGGVMSRNKGKRGEREIVDLLQSAVDTAYATLRKEQLLPHDMVAPVLQRNLMQAHLGGNDLRGVDWLSAEIKYAEQLHPTQWWEQCLQQTQKGQVPVLFYRKNHASWRVRMNVSIVDDEHEFVADFDLEPFLNWFQRELEARLFEEAKSKGIPKVALKPVLSFLRPVNGSRG